MALFQRKKVDPSVLPEVDKYYSAERRDRAGLAWVLALVSIIVVAAIITALFLAGRFIYNNLTDDNNDTVGTSNIIDEDVTSFDGNSTDVDTNEMNDNNDTDDDVEVAPPAVTTPAPTTTPTTGDSPLPRTGPSSLIATFAGVTTASAAAHYAISSRRKS